MENQADAERDATLADRLKMAGMTVDTFQLQQTPYLICGPCMHAAIRAYADDMAMVHVKH